MTAETESLRRWLLLAWLCFLMPAATAEAADLAPAPKVYLPPCFADNLVLQKPPLNPGDAPLIWGWADKRCDVFVGIGPTNVIRAQAWDEVPAQDPLKTWVVRYSMLGATPALPEGLFEIKIIGRKRKSETFTNILHNVVAGEVWLLVDPEFAVSPAPASSPSKAATDVRVLKLRMGNFAVKPADAGSITAGGWQILNESQTRPDNPLAVSAYYLDSLPSSPATGPVGVLLIGQTEWVYFSQYLPENDFVKLPGDQQLNPRFAQPWMDWKNAWQRAGDEWKSSWKNYDANLALLKRRGKVPISPPPKMPQLPHPSINSEGPPTLKFTVRGTLH